MADSIQTDNRSGLQVGIELSVDQQLARIEHAAPLPHVFDAMQSPDPFLVALAIERGVVDWSEDDSERARRMTTRDAMLLHRQSCTLGGIRRSVQALGFDAVVSRLRPYVVGVEAELTDTTLTAELQERLARRVDVYRAGRDSVELSLVLSSLTPVYVGIASTDGDELDVQPWQTDDITLEVQAYVGVADTIFDDMDTYPWLT